MAFLSIWIFRTHLHPCHCMKYREQSKRSWGFHFPCLHKGLKTALEVETPGDGFFTGLNWKVTPVEATVRWLRPSTAPSFRWYIVRLTTAVDYHIAIVLHGGGFAHPRRCLKCDRLGTNISPGASKRIGEEHLPFFSIFFIHHSLPSYIISFRLTPA